MRVSVVSLRWWLMVAFLGASPGCEVRCSTGGTESTTGANAAATVPTTPQVAGPYTQRPATNVAFPAAEAIQRATQEFYVGWSHPNLTAGEEVRVQLVALDLGTPGQGTVVLETTMNAPGAGPNSGTASFTAPPAGWPAGQHRVVVRTAAGPFGQVDFPIQ